MIKVSYEFRCDGCGAVKLESFDLNGRNVPPVPAGRNRLEHWILCEECCAEAHEVLRKHLAEKKAKLARQGVVL